MTDINFPKEWIESTLAEICYLNPKNTLTDDTEVGFLPMNGVPKSFGEKNIFEVKKWSEVKKGYTHFADGDTIFAKITPCFENSKASIIEKFPNGHGSGSTEYFVLRSIGSYVNPKLLLALVRTNEFLREGAANMSGSVGHKRVPKEFVENFVFPLPPLAEQQQIAQKLDELLAQVDTLKTRLDAIPKILKRFRQSVLAAAVSGKLTEEWRGENELAAPTDKALKEMIVALDQGWSPKCLSEVGADDDWAVIKTSSVQKVNFVKEENKKLPASFDARPELSLKKGDVLITRAGPRVRCGVTCLVKKDHPKLMICDKVYRIRTNTEVLIPEYLNFLFNSPQYLEVIEELKTGSSESGMNMTMKKLVEIILLTPRAVEQLEIIKRVEQLFAYADQIEQRVKDAQARVNHLTQSILAKAFRGELTADWRAQNPELISGENSAAALLERIKVERALTLKPKRKTKT